MRDYLYSDIVREWTEQTGQTLRIVSAVPRLTMSRAPSRLLVLRPFRDLGVPALTTLRLCALHVHHFCQCQAQHTGAAGKSIAGYKQFQAFSKTFGSTIIDTSKQICVRFGIGSTKSLGVINIPTPIGPCIFHIVNCNTPFLLFLQDLDEKGIIFNNLDNLLLLNSTTIPVVRIFGHVFLQWGPVITTSIMT